MEQSSVIKDFYFTCENCKKTHSFDEFQHAIVYSGLIVLANDSEGYLGVQCQRCKKVTINKLPLEQIIAVWDKLSDSTGVIGIRSKEKIFSFISQKITFTKSLSYNSFSKYYQNNPSFYCKDTISIYFNGLHSQSCLLSANEFKNIDEYYLSYLPLTAVDGDNLLIYGINKKDIHKIIGLENKTQKKIIPRYYYRNNLPKLSEKYSTNQIDYPQWFETNLEFYNEKKNCILEKIQFLNILEAGKKFYDIIKQDEYELIFFPDYDAYVNYNNQFLSDSFQKDHKLPFNITLMPHHGNSDSFTKKIITEKNEQIPKELDAYLSKILVQKTDDQANHKFYSYATKKRKISFEQICIKLLNKIWNQFTDEHIQNVLQKGIDNYRIAYAIEAEKIDFSVISIIKLSAGFIKRIEGLIKNKGNKEAFRKPSKEISKIAAQYDQEYPSLKNIISNDHSISTIKINIVLKYSKNDLPVLILGDTGTGKELIARAIHDVGLQKQYFRGPLITVNCGGIPKDLLESELFGHVKGAFSGAITEKMGMIEAANNGVLFLDEIGALDINHQTKLLRALEYKEITRLGDIKGKCVNFKLVCATNQDLEKEIEKGKFKNDFFYRINGDFPISLPLLRERNPEDIELLCNHFLKAYSDDDDEKEFTPDSMKKLVTCSWPGNIRQLKNFIENKAVFSNGRYIKIAKSELKSLESKKSWKKEIKPQDELTLTDKRKLPHQVFLTELENNNGDRSKTARKLGVTPKTVFERIRKMTDLGMEVPPPPPKKQR